PEDAQPEERGRDEHETPEGIEAERARQRVGQVRPQEREREVSEVDEAKQAPRQGEPQAEESVEPSDEEPREHRLREEREAGHARTGVSGGPDPDRDPHGTCSWAPGAANSFGQTTSHFPSCTCFTLDRSSP